MNQEPEQLTNPWAVTIGEAMGLTEKTRPVTIGDVISNRPRPLSEIAREALGCDTLKGNARAWAGAYLEPMTTLDTVHDTYGMDSGRSIVMYALSNLSAWRGDDARRIKAELKAHLKG